MNAEQEWQRLYFVAIRETDKTKIQERIAIAEAAMYERLRQISLGHDGTPDENEAITKTLNALSVLRNEVDDWPPIVDL